MSRASCLREGGNSPATSRRISLIIAGVVVATRLICGCNNPAQQPTQPPAPFNCLSVASATMGTAPLPVNFRGAVSGGTEPYAWRWEFGDSTSTVPAAVTHAYRHPGDYTARLTVTDARHDTCSSLAGRIRVRPRLDCTASGAPLTGPLPLTVEFSSQVSGGFPPHAYHWDFGDRTSSADTAASHLYSFSGVYHPRLAVADSLGDTASVVMPPIGAGPLPFPNRASVGRGGGIQVPGRDHNPCNGTLMLNYDGSGEDAYCW